MHADGIFGRATRLHVLDADPSLMTAFDSVLPVFVEMVFGWGQTGQGLVFLPFFLLYLLEPLSGMVLDRYPVLGKFMTAVALLLATPFLASLQLVTNNTLDQKALLCALLAPIGTCVAIGIAPLLAEISYLIQAIQRDNPGVFGKYGATAQGYGLSTAAFAAVGLVEPVWAGMIRDRYEWGTMSWSLAVLTGVSLFPVLLLFGVGGYGGGKVCTNESYRHIHVQDRSNCCSHNDF